VRLALPLSLSLARAALLFELTSILPLAVLRENGTAVDAAIATALCVGVVNSFSSGIGGGGFMVIRPPSLNSSTSSSSHLVFPSAYSSNPRCTHPISIDFREAAPALARADMFTRDARPDDPEWNPARASKVGGLAVGVPGELRGFEAAYHACGGGVSWARLFAPAAELAREFAVGKELSRRLNTRISQWTGGKGGPTLNEWIRDEDDWAEVFMREGKGKDGRRDVFLQEGDTVRRRAYGDTLERLGRDGASAFYEGEIADALVETTRAAGGILTRDDMRSYRAVVRRAEEGTYRGRRYYTGSYPSGGPILRHLLNVLDGFDDFAEAGQTPLTEHRFIEALKCASLALLPRLDRARRTELTLLPTFVRSQSPLPPAPASATRPSSTTTSASPRSRPASLPPPCVPTSPTCVALEPLSLRPRATRPCGRAPCCGRSIWPERVLMSSILPPQDRTHHLAYYNPQFDVLEDHGTTHMSTMDQWGGAVALTSTVNLIFGSRVLDAKTGIILNDEMDDFATPGIPDAFGLRRESTVCLGLSLSSSISCSLERCAPPANRLTVSLARSLALQLPRGRQASPLVDLALHHGSRLVRRRLAHDGRLGRLAHLRCRRADAPQPRLGPRLGERRRAAEGPPPASARVCESAELPSLSTCVFVAVVDRRARTRGRSTA